ncbi:MAG: Ca binding protein [Phycisphaerales bacterium]|nr:Ca binding protein [Phycisphaerales bacterium]
MRHYSHWRNWGTNPSNPRVFIELLESRSLFSASVAPTVLTSLPDSFNGFTFVVSADPGGPSRVTVTGTPGDDVMKVSLDASDPSLFKFELNGAVLEVKRGPTDWLFGPGGSALELDGGAGNDLIVDNLPAGSYRYVYLNGGDGNDTLIGSNGSPTFSIKGPDGMVRSFALSDFLNGGAGDDILVGGTLTQGIDGAAGNDEIFVGPNMKTVWLGSGRSVVHSFMGMPQPLRYYYAQDANGQFTGQVLPYYGESNAPGNFGPDAYLLAFSTTGSTLFLGRAESFDGGTPGDRNIDQSGMDPLPSSPTSPALLVGDVLWINGTAGNDTAKLALDHTGQYLLVDVNGEVTRFKASDVHAYAFNAAGGKDTLQLNNKNGPLPIAGWTVNTGNPDDTVTTQQITAPFRGDFAGPEFPAGQQPPAEAPPETSPVTPVPPASIVPAASAATRNVPALIALPPSVTSAQNPDDKHDKFDAAQMVDSVNTGEHVGAAGSGQ